MNKTFLTIARIIALVTGILMLVAAGFIAWLAIPVFAFGAGQVNYLFNGLIFRVIVMVPIGIFNIIASNKIKSVEEGKADISVAKNWSIYLIFTTVIGGIFGLIGSTNSNEINPQSTSNLETELTNLKNLYDRGLITQAEYDMRRAAILNKM